MAMQVLRRYMCETSDRIVRHYATVRLDDGSTVELGSATPLSDEELLALAVQSLPVEPEPSVLVEAEDGTVV